MTPRTKNNGSRKSAVLEPIYNRIGGAPALKAAVDAQYPRLYPQLADKYAVHVCNLVDGVAVLKGI